MIIEAVEADYVSVKRSSSSDYKNDPNYKISYACAGSNKVNSGTGYHKMAYIKDKQEHYYYFTLDLYKNNILGDSSVLPIIEEMNTKEVPCKIWYYGKDIKYVYYYTCDTSNENKEININYKL